MEKGRPTEAKLRTAGETPGPEIAHLIAEVRACRADVATLVTTESTGRQFLTLLSDSATCIAIAAGGGYLTHHPSTFWDSHAATAVAGALLYILGAAGSALAVEEFFTNAVMRRHKPPRTRVLAALLISPMIVAIIAAYVATFAAFSNSN